MKNCKIFCQIAAMVLIAVIICTNAMGQGKDAKNPAVSADVVRHQVEIVSVPPDPAKASQTNTILVKTEGWQALLLHEGVTISMEEWATATDLLKASVASSSVFRAVSMGMAKSAETKDASVSSPSMTLLARFGAGTAGNRVFLTLLDSASGKTLYSADSTRTTMLEAVNTALSDIETKAALMTWYCRIVARKDKEMIIDRGRFDGIRKGQQYVGYALSREAGDNKNMQAELIVMKFGTRKGLYEVSEEGQDFSKVIPVADAPLLSAGDILELPSVDLPDRQRDNRSHRAWDKIYSK